jgi:hypothetical protein
MSEDVLAKRSHQIVEAFSMTLAPRLLAPVLQKLIETEGPEVVEELVGCAAAASSQTSRPADLRQLWKACISAFEREENTRDAEVLAATADAAAEVAFHLSEAEFRPLFLQLVSNLETEHSSAHAFCLGSSLLVRLKSLAVGWCARLAPFVVKTVSEQEDLFAAQYALDFAQALFANDIDRVIDKDIHSSLIDPLVEAFDRDELREKAQRAIVDMANSMNSDALWKPLNYSILLKLRSKNPQVRIVALTTTHELWQRFGEDFLLLLPDTMPALGEIMEDSNEDVVREAQTLLAKINSYLPNAITF